MILNIAFPCRAVHTQQDRIAADTTSGASVMAMHIGSQGKTNDDNNAAQEEPDSPPPVLVFLNGASGGKKGLVVRRKIEPLIPSAQ